MHRKDNAGFYTGPVIHGKKIGRTIGFPTANVFLGTQIPPPPGTYGCICTIGDFASHWNDDVQKVAHSIGSAIYTGLACHREGMDMIEIHLIDRTGDLYGQTITISLVSFLRENHPFSGLDALKTQIVADRETRKNTRVAVMNFGTFDLLHHGHLWLMRKSRMLGTQLHTVVSNDHNRKSDTTHSMEERKKNIQLRGFPHHTVHLGDPKNYLTIPHLVSPDIFAIGYDQCHAAALLQGFSLTHQVVEIESYHPERFKSSLLR